MSGLSTLRVLRALGYEIMLRYEMNKDIEIFRRTKHSRWSIYRAEKLNGYAYHNRCSGVNYEGKGFTDEWKGWSWFVTDTSADGGIARCYGCGTKVPGYIQALLRMIRS